MSSCAEESGQTGAAIVMRGVIEIVVADVTESVIVTRAATVIEIAAQNGSEDQTARLERWTATGGSCSDQSLLCITSGLLFFPMLRMQHAHLHGDLEVDLESRCLFEDGSETSDRLWSMKH